MRWPSFRVRTLMMMVVVVALLIWGSMMGLRSYDYYGRARKYAEDERGWREFSARRNGSMGAFASECAEYFAGLTRKYRRATWRPWLHVEPDPWAPGAEAAYQQQELESTHQKAPTKNEK